MYYFSEDVVIEVRFVEDDYVIFFMVYYIDGIS